MVEDDALPAAATALARRLADGPALAYSTTKVLLTRELDMDLGSAIEMEAVTQALLGVDALFDPEAMVELVGVAVVP